MADAPDKMKATSPSKLVQGVVDQSWDGAKGTPNPKQALADKFTGTKHQVKPGK